MPEDLRSGSSTPHHFAGNHVTAPVNASGTKKMSLLGCDADLEERIRRPPPLVHKD